MKRSYWMAMSILLLIAFIISGLSSPILAMSPQEVYEKAKVDFEKVIKAGKKEGHVQVYGGFEPNQQKVLMNIWNKKYPEIKIEVVEGRHELQARIEAQLASGRVEVDMTQGPSPTNWVEKAKGFFQPIFKEVMLPNLADPSAKWFEKPIIDPEGYYIQGTWGALWGMAVNTNMVPSNKVPKSYMDLTDPYWKEKVYMGHPAGDSIGGKWFFFTMNDPKLGKSFHEKLAKQNFTIYMGGSSSALKACAKGEYPLQFPAGSHAVAELDKSIPVTYVFPKEGIISQLNNWSIIKGAPHANAALVFINFLLSKEGMTALAVGGRYVARADAELPFPKFQKIEGDMALYQWPDEKHYVKVINDYYKEARKIYKTK